MRRYEGSAEHVRERFAEVRERVAAAARAAGRDAGEVEILVATKYVDADGLGVLREAGIRLSARTAPRTWSRSTRATATPSPGTSSATCRAARPSWCCRSCASSTRSAA